MPGSAKQELTCASLWVAGRSVGSRISLLGREGRDDVTTRNVEVGHLLGLQRLHNAL